MPEISYEDLVAGLRARTDLPEKAGAAVHLLLWHESWLRRPDFRQSCTITRPAEILWLQTRKFYDGNPVGASTSQMIVLEVALAIAEDHHNFRHLGEVHRYRVAEAFATALGQELAGPEPVSHNHPSFIPAEGPCPACDRAAAQPEPADTATVVLAKAVLQLADVGGMPDTYWQTDSRVALARRVLDIPDDGRYTHAHLWEATDD